ncbi:NAD(P)/FAD-dependent oxidoreductase [Nakamurella sp. A5-74]|uniref:NAD(P)/FAD-dependent oxidoreductase n=1 Tax=Nakamurella sp. A5-74 TaxID=3158264 RepID=A0AAU8DLP6_9ACTN
MNARHVVVVGAGPAGLSAAAAAAERGATVTLLDSADQLGGQYWRHLPAERAAEDEAVLHHGWQTFGQLQATLATSPGVQIVRQAQVWSLETAGTTTGSQNAAAVLHVLIGEVDSPDRRLLTLGPDALVLATGAHDRTLPFPGWTLPGVFTAGAAQALAKGERIAVGERVVVAGAGPFLLPVASSLSQAGARVAAVIEAGTLRSLAAGWLSKPWQLVGAAHKSGELFGYLTHQLRGRIPYRTARAVIEAHGSDRVEAVTTAAVDHRWAPIPGTEEQIACDAVCVSHGFTPRLELAIAAGAAISAERFVVVDADQRTSVRAVFAAGEITGIGGVDAALVEGRIAGHVAAGGSHRDRELGTAHRDRLRTTAFAHRIEAAHGIRPGWTGWLRPDTIVCRCEETTLAAVHNAVAATDSRSLRSTKLSTRAGLGICQARICGRSVETLLAETTDTTAAKFTPPPGSGSDGAGSDRRPIVTPIRLGELAALTGDPVVIDPPPTSGPPTAAHAHP